MFHKVYYAYANSPIKGINVFHLFLLSVSVLRNRKEQRNNLLFAVRLAIEISLLTKCQNVLENLIKTLAESTLIINLVQSQE